MLMMRVRGRALRVVSKLVLLAMLVAALTVALVPVALADGHLQAADGQSLNDQPPDVQALYRSVYGAGAAARWVEDHNAAIGEMGMDAPPAMTDLYLTVRHVAWQRSGDAELAARIAADVMARGTAEAFLAGTDTGVVWGVWTEPEPMGMGMGMGSSSSSSSTSSGPATPTSPSTGTVSSWKSQSVSWLVGTQVSLTLPSSDLAGVDGYDLDGTIPGGLKFDPATRQLSGTPTTATAAEGVALTYTAQEDGTPVGTPFSMVLTVRIHDRDDLPSFGGASVMSITLFDGQTISDGRSDALPEVADDSGNEPITYSVSGLPDGVIFADDTRQLAGTAPMIGSYPITYIATDDDGDTASLSFTVTVEADTMPSLPAVANVTVKEGQMWRFQLPAATGGNGALTYTVAGDIGSLSVPSAFTARTRYIQATIPTDVLDDNDDSETFELTYTVVDTYKKSGGTDSVEVKFKVTVTPAS